MIPPVPPFSPGRRGALGAISRRCRRRWGAARLLPREHSSPPAPSREMTGEVLDAADISDRSWQINSGEGHGRLAPGAARTPALFCRLRRAGVRGRGRVRRALASLESPSVSRPTARLADAEHRKHRDTQSPHWRSPDPAEIPAVEPPGPAVSSRPAPGAGEDGPEPSPLGPLPPTLDRGVWGSCGHRLLLSSRAGGRVAAVESPRAPRGDGARLPPGREHSPRQGQTLAGLTPGSGQPPRAGSPRPGRPAGGAHPCALPAPAVAAA